MKLRQLGAFFAGKAKDLYYRTLQGPYSQHFFFFVTYELDQ